MFINLAAVVVVLSAVDIISSSDANCSFFTNRTITCGNESVTCNLVAVLNEIGSYTLLSLQGEQTVKVTESMLVSNRVNICIRGENQVMIICGVPDIDMSFQSVRNLSIQNIAIVGCGVGTSSVALSIINSSHVILVNILVSGGEVKFNNTVGLVSIKDSSFNGTMADVDEGYTSGRGVNVLLNSSGVRAIYKFEKCNFSRNYPSDINGGGGVHVHSTNSEVNIVMTQVMFEENRANNGGGMSIFLGDSNFENTVELTNVTFVRNRAVGVVMALGGGLLVTLATEYGSGRNITFVNVQFHENIAWIGGGSAFMVSRSQNYSSKRSEITIVDCEWLHNKAQSGAAVVITRYHLDLPSHGLLPLVNFHNSSVINNTNVLISDLHQTLLPGWIGYGVIFFLHTDIALHNGMTFYGNRGSAVAVLDGSIIFKGNTTFGFNSGWKGGAIHLNGLAYMTIDKGVTVNFINNTVLHKGGAIYSNMLDEQLILTSTACPIRSSDPKLVQPIEWNATFYFMNNTAQENGNSIFLTSLLPCQYAYAYNDKSTNVFASFPTVFHFEPAGVNEVATAVTRIVVLQNHTYAIPGHKFYLPISLKGTLSKPKDISLIVRLNDSSSRISLTNRRICVENASLTLHGPVGELVFLTMIVSQVPHLSQTVNVTLAECPLGFRNRNGSCVCLTRKELYGLAWCQDSTLDISLYRGTWGGYYKGQPLTSVCPLWFCSYSTHRSTDHSKEIQRIFHLPPYLPNSQQNYSDVLQDEICSENRYGLLCGQCKHGNSVYFNSPTLKCNKNTDLCKIGWALYILTSPLPLTLMFLGITALRISFTTGGLRGFVFFSQIIVTLDLTNGGTLLPFNRIEVLSIIWRMFYNIFNLRFFYFDKMSFCLIENASSLDVLAIQYIATVYVFLLISCTIFCLNHCTLRCHQISKCLRFTVLKGSFVDSLAALLILCYGNSVYTSLLILNTITLRVPGKDEKRVYLQPDLFYMQKEHLVYAIPALVCVCTIVLVPIVMFTIFPLVHLIIVKFRLQNTKVGTLFSKCYLGGRLKPFYDVFQSDYKEECHFFSGLYFLYNLLILVSFPATDTYSVNVFITLGILAVTLTVHSLAQPYTNRYYNMIDTLLLANLIAINGLSCISYTITITTPSDIVTMFQITQVFLIYFPIIALIIYATLLCWRKCKRQKKKFSRKEEYDALVEEESIDTFPRQRRESVNDLIAQEQERELYNY